MSNRRLTVAAVVGAAVLLGGCTGVGGSGDGGGSVPSTTLSEGGELVPVGEQVVRQEQERARQAAAGLAARVGGTTPPGRPAQETLEIEDLPGSVTSCDLTDEEWPKYGEVTLTFDFLDPHAQVERLAGELEDEGWEVRFTRGDDEVDTGLTAIRPDGIGVTITATTRRGFSGATFGGFTGCVGEDGSLGR